MSNIMKKAFTGLAFGLVCAVCSTTAFSQTLGVLKSPYMIYPNVTSEMQVLWQDNGTETDTINWGTDTTYSLGTAPSTEYNTTATNFATNPVSTTQLHQHAYTITGLQTSTTYYYQVVDANGVSWTGSFMTAPDANATSVRFLAQGDSRSQPFALDGLMQVMMQFYNQPGNADYQRLAIANGDWVSTDGDSYWTNEWFQPAQTHVRAYTANVPMDGCKGNHDNASGYSASFPKYYPYPYPTGSMVPKTTSCTTNSTSHTVQQDPNTGYCTDANGNPYYNNLWWSFDYGPVHFTVIDEYSTMTSGSPQYNWVQNDLASTTKPWKIMIYHEPAYSSGSDGDNTGVRVFEALITQYNVDLVFSGHSHNYARCGAYNATQAGSDLIALNVPHFTSGGGGAPVYQVDQTNKGSYPHVITAWPSIEFMTFDVEGNTLAMSSYQANGINQGATAPQTGLSYTMIEQTVLHHYPNVTPQVTAQLGNLVYNHSSKTYNGTVTLTNNGVALSGDLHVVLDGMLNLQGINTVGTGAGQLSNQYSTTNPKNTTMIANNPGAYKSAPAGTGLISNVTLVNQTGSNNGEPMIKAPLNGNGLAAGASVTVPLTFSNPTGGSVAFNPIILNELPGE